ncbi:hypothetical protein [Nocardioides sp. J54]|uniref:hypothetical protein n=1 Tax=Nocardioides sp. J54 TaxID=935866 RepID=UPI0004B0221C|nr:hypothetical protein [Nocardioides sp. J54]
MSDRTQALVVAVLTTLLAVTGVAGSSALSGPVLWEFSETHGVHLEDAVIVPAWLICLLCCWSQWRRGDRRDR